VDRFRLDDGIRNLPPNGIHRRYHQFGVRVSGHDLPAESLLGEAPEMSRSPAAGLRNAMLRGVRRQLIRCVEVVGEEVGRHSRLAGIDPRSTRQFLEAAAEMLDAVQAFVRINSAVFEDLCGSAAVLRKAETLEQALHDAATGSASRSRSTLICASAVAACLMAISISASRLEKPSGKE
jgi:hypothetical protein